MEKNVTILGTGYVGLVTGACLAQFGHKILCADINADKISTLQHGNIPIFEQGLSELVAPNVKEGRLSFTHDLAHAITSASIILVAIGTPADATGKPDLTALESAIASFAQHITEYKLIIIKSTVPVGTCRYLEQLLCSAYGVNKKLFDIAYNPEFLREGKAVEDFMHPDRLVFGGQESVISVVNDLFRPLIDAGVPVIATTFETAEAIKYASNAFLGLKVSFINEIANLCDRIGIDAHTVAQAVGLDKRIGPHFLMPGPGFGGSCFPKDIQALVRTADQYNVELHTIKATLVANEIQCHKAVEKLLRLLPNLNGKTICILGLAFKANTDDVRESPAIKTIQLLLDHGASVNAYDPAAMHNMRQLFPHITYYASMYQAAQDTDAVIIMTEWQEFKFMDLQYLKIMMRTPILIDARTILNPVKVKSAGLICDNIGKSYACVEQDMPAIHPINQEPELKEL